MRQTSRFPRRYGILSLALAPLAACAPTTPAPPPAPAPEAAPASAPPLPLIPLPASVQMSATDTFRITAATSILVEPASPQVQRVAEQLGSLLRVPTGFPLAVSPAAGADADGDIVLRLGGGSDLGEEGYRLEVTATGVTLTADRPAGLFHGIQTIRQLLPPAVEAEQAMRRAGWTLPAGTIVDRPRFAWRGAMLDVARHFFTVDEVKQYIDAMALYKLNILHLHLSDDQGWRIQINSRPRLTEVSGGTEVGGGRGGFYTQAEYSDLVAYAQERYITVVPEIDMPAHTNAALAAFPELSCGTRPAQTYIGTDVGFSALCVDNEETYKLVDDVVRELSALTPGPYLHVGGDEVQALTDEQYARFIERVQEIVTRHGKRMVGWEEITKAKLLPSTLVQQWKSDSATAAVAYGAKLVLSPASRAYLDMKYDSTTELGLDWAGLVPVRTAYDWDPATLMTGVGEADIAGVEAPLWSETIQNITAAEFLAFPRLPAIAEVGWSPAASRDWERFRLRLAAQGPRWNWLGINYYRAPEVPWKP